MPGGFGAWSVTVEGYEDVSRAFKGMSKDAKKDLRQALKRAGEPVRQEAERLAAGEIRNIHPGDRWSLMRLGVTSRYVYIAPKARRAGGSGRSNLAGLLIQEAMLPAAKAREDETRAELENAMYDLAARYGF